MRIIPNGTKKYLENDAAEFPTIYYEDDTIEITDDEWDEIGVGFFLEHDNWNVQLSQYLRELIELARAK